MPRIWTDTINEHRRSVSEAILDAAGSLADTEGPSAVTMSGIAQSAGIGRATLYKYFGDVEQVLVAWHQRHIKAHLAQLEAARLTAPNAGAALEAVLKSYGEIIRAHHEHALANVVHRLPHAVHARAHLRSFILALVEDAAKAGQVRTDTPLGELTDYALAAIAAAEVASVPVSVSRLVRIIMAGLSSVEQLGD